MSDFHSDIPVSLTTGQLTSDPGLCSHSPNRKYKLAGEDTGQGGEPDYTIMMEENGWYDFSVRFLWGHLNKLTQFYWINNNEFICSAKDIDDQEIYLRGKLEFWPNKKVETE